MKQVDMKQVVLDMCNTELKLHEIDQSSARLANPACTLFSEMVFMQRLNTISHTCKGETFSITVQISIKISKFYWFKYKLILNLV